MKNDRASPFAPIDFYIQTGVFDGQENPVIWAKSTKFYEVQKYLSITNHLYTVMYLLMSEPAYQKLDADTQAILKQAGREATAYSVEVGIKADNEIVDFLKTKGMQVNQADIAAFVAASKPIWGDWATETGGDAQPHSRFADAAGEQGLHAETCANFHWIFIGSAESKRGGARGNAEIGDPAQCITLRT